MDIDILLPDLAEAFFDYSFLNLMKPLYWFVWPFPFCYCELLIQSKQGKVIKDIHRIDSISLMAL